MKRATNPAANPAAVPAANPASTIRTVAIAGASGFIGAHLVGRFRALGAEVRTIGRSGPVRWGDTEAIAGALDGVDLLVNLAGRSVNCRYNRRNADAIFSSRVDTTEELGRALALCRRNGGTPPPVWINSSTGTIYRHATDRPQTEHDGDLGTGFSVSVARAWEQALADADAPGTRKVALRLSIVLGPGSVMTPLTVLARTGLGGPMGPGTQKFSWIHLDDVFRAVVFIANTPSLSGPVNAAAPDVVTNAALMTAVRSRLGVPAGLPTPAWLLELGGRIIRTEAELVLKSRWVAPRKLVDAGFIFDHPTLGPALDDILGPDRVASVEPSRAD
ncbi:TIGR01777 family protein [Arthrobacter pityocampae]|uniref:TIGR01777 family protein n=1 Tax=Arthrobacter pityocampae TaxID=547334 RepID=A0A2S5IUG5_9MICC|nr:TIGR01777 family oxidoreductase [Arthrobacter pityocampae]PPB48195.1 TIGR01777 family protein [Arthrobacter pityocampae]